MRRLEAGPRRLASELAAGAILALAIGCAPAGDVGADPEAGGEAGEAMAAAELPDTVRIEEPGLHPEGIEYDARRGRFLVSSVTEGTVTAVEDDGAHAVFIDDPDIVSSIGIDIDEERDRLLVASSDVAAFQTGGGRALLGAYDLETGERIFMTDLAPLTEGENNFANDIAVGPDGTAYVTNSMTPAIYAVTPEGEASVLAEGGALAEGGFLNGIEFHPDGYLLVAHAGARGLLKVTLGDGGATISRVTLPEPFGADGLTLTGDADLVAVATTGEGESMTQEILLLSSGDDWASAEIAARAAAAAAATTVAVRNGEVYVLDARFGDMGSEPPAPHFDITRVRLE